MEEQLGFVADINSKPMEDGLNRIEERVESTAKAVEKSGMSVDDFAKHMQGVLSSFEKLTQAVDRNTKAQEQVAEAGKKAADAEKQGADKATDAIQKTDKATQGLGGSLKKTGDEGAAGFDKLQKAAAGFFTLAAAKEFGQKVFEVRSEIQSLQTSFETLVGNKPQAEELFNSIKDFATHTPMQLKDLASAAQTMMSFNIPVEQIMENLKALGDVSMGDAQKFQSLSLSFSQMSATGKLMGQDLLQMINAGFNPLATISEKTGKSIEKLKDEMSKGAISADMVRQAFIDATSEGGKFHGMLEAQSKTLGGAYSNLQGAISDMFNSIGEQTEGIMAGAINAATVLVQNYEKVGQILLGLVATYGTYKTAVIAVTLAETTATGQRMIAVRWTQLQAQAQAILNKTMLANPYVAAATALGLLVGAIIAARDGLTDAERAQRDYNDILDEAKKKQEDYNNETQEAIRLAQDDSAATGDRESAMQTLIERYPKIIQKYIDEKGHLTDILNLKREIAAYDGQQANVDNKIRSDLYKEYVRVINKQMRGEALDEREGRLYGYAVSKYNKATPWYQPFSQKGAIDYFTAMQKQASRAYGRGETTAKVNSMLEKMGEMKTDELKKLSKVLNANSVKIQKGQAIYVKEVGDYLEASDLQNLTVKANGILDARNPKKKELTDKEKKAAERAAAKAAKEEQKQAEDDATERQKLFEQQEADRVRISKERQELKDALTDAEIAKIKDNGERERQAREEQHKRKIREIRAQEEQFKREAYKRAEAEWNAKNRDKTKVFSDTEEGKAEWQGQKLSESQKAIIKAQEELANAEYQRYVDERHKKELSASYEFLKQYGNYEQQKLAITKEYEQKIQEASTPAEKASLSAQQDKELKELSKKELEDTIDWAGVFNDLSGHTEKYLLGLREQLQNLLKTGDLPIDQMATIQAKVREIDEELNKQGGIFSHMSDAQREHNRRLAEAKDAQEALNAALNEQFNAQMSVNIATSNASELLKGLGLSLGDVTQDSSLLDEVAAKFGGKDSDVYKKVEAAITKVRTAETKLSEARNNVAKNAPKWKKAQDAVNEGFKDMVARVADNIKEWVNYYLGDLPGLLSEIGLNSASEKASQGLSAVNNAAGAAADFASGNYVGAALKAVSAVKDFGRVLGIGGGNEAKINAQLEKLADRNEILTTAINELTETLSGSSGSNALKQYEKLVDSQKELEKNLIKQAHLQMEYHSAHGSFNHYWEGFSQAQLNQFNKRNGTSWNGDLATINAEIAKMLMGDADMWQQIKDTGKGGYGGRVAERLKDLAEQAGKLEEYTAQLQERITGQSFDSIFDDFMSSLFDLADGSEDVFENIAENWEKMMNKMVLTNLVGEKYKRELKKWYDQWEEVYSGDENITEEEVIKLRNDYQDLIHKAADEVETLREQGIITATSDSPYTQNASSKGFQSMGQDTAEELNGRFTALQIAGEEMNANIGVITAILNSLDTLSRVDSVTFSELRDLAVTRNSYLEDIARYTKRIPAEMEMTLNNIYKRQEDLLNAIRRA